LRKPIRNCFLLLFEPDILELDDDEDDEGDDTRLDLIKLY